MPPIQLGPSLFPRTQLSINEHNTGFEQRVFLNCQLLCIFHSQVHWLGHQNLCLFLSFFSLAHAHLTLGFDYDRSLGQTFLSPVPLAQSVPQLTVRFVLASHRPVHVESHIRSIPRLPGETSESFSPTTFKTSALVPNSTFWPNSPSRNFPLLMNQVPH